MTDMLCSMNGAPVLHATVILPRWGVWTADIEAANLENASGAATIQLADLTLSGTIQSGGVYSTRGWYRVVGGAGGWSNILKPRSYQSDAGVKLSSILGDAAREVGETMAAFTDQRVGPAYVRPASLAGDGMSIQAGRLLDAFAQEAWYVDEAGKTHVGVRAASTYDAAYRLLDARPDLFRLMLAADSIAGLLPGASFTDLTDVATVRHELGPEGLRSHVYANVPGSQSHRAWREIARIVRAIAAPYFYLGRYEYTVFSVANGRADLVPVQASLGLPPVSNVPMRSGIMGGRGTPASGSVVLLGFINGDPTRPYVDSYDSEDAGADAIPPLAEIFATTVKLGDATASFLARADKVDAELAKIQTAHNTHVHLLTIAAQSGSGGTGTSAPPAIAYSPTTTACTNTEGT